MQARRCGRHCLTASLMNTWWICSHSWSRAGIHLDDIATDETSRILACDSEGGTDKSATEIMPPWHRNSQWTWIMIIKQCTLPNCTKLITSVSCVWLVVVCVSIVPPCSSVVTSVSCVWLVVACVSIVPLCSSVVTSVSCVWQIHTTWHHLVKLTVLFVNANWPFKASSTGLHSFWYNVYTLLVVSHYMMWYMLLAEFLMHLV